MTKAGRIACTASHCETAQRTHAAAPGKHKLQRGWRFTSSLPGTKILSVVTHSHDVKVPARAGPARQQANGT